MSNYYVTELTINNKFYGKTLAALVSPDTEFDLNKAVPAPESLPAYNREVLLSLAHHLIANKLDQKQMDQIAESLPNHVEDADDFADLVDEFQDLIDGVEPQRVSQLLQAGFDAYKNLQDLGFIFAEDWKQSNWGVTAVEAVEVKGRVIKLYSREDLMNFVVAWSKLASLDLSVNLIDSGCHHCLTAHFVNGECGDMRRDEKKTMKKLAQSLLGYTEDELV